MNYPATVQQFYYGNHTINLWVPDVQAVKQSYLTQKTEDLNLPFPFWAQVWTSAIVLANFIYQNNYLVKDKTVLELAAGLGLPSMVAACFATKVISTDYLSDAVESIKQSTSLNGFHNVTPQLLDWNSLPDNLTADVLLLSDINYEPHAFAILEEVLAKFRQQGTAIILSTPQRLMAKPFIAQLLPFCTNHHIVETEMETISILEM